MENTAEATTVELLRNIHPQAWAEIAEPNGWTYHTNIGHLAHRAADELEQARAMSKRWKYACKFHKHFHHEYRKMSEYLRKERDLKVLEAQTASKPLET